MPQSSCYNNTGSTKTGSTKLQPKSSDALTQKIPSPLQATQGTCTPPTLRTHTPRRAQTHTCTHLRLLREQQTKAVNTAADGWADKRQSHSQCAPWLTGSSAAPSLGRAFHTKRKHLLRNASTHSITASLLQRPTRSAPGRVQLLSVCFKLSGLFIYDRSGPDKK